MPIPGAPGNEAGCLCASATVHLHIHGLVPRAVRHAEVRQVLAHVSSGQLHGIHFLLAMANLQTASQTYSNN